MTKKKPVKTTKQGTPHRPKTPNVFTRKEWAEIIPPYAAVKADMQARGYGDRAPNGWLKHYLDVELPAAYQGRRVEKASFIQQYKAWKARQEAKEE